MQREQQTHAMRQKTRKTSKERDHSRQQSMFAPQSDTNAQEPPAANSFSALLRREKKKEKKKKKKGKKSANIQRDKENSQFVQPQVKQQRKKEGKKKISMLVSEKSQPHRLGTQTLHNPSPFLTTHPSLQVK
jgi:hypothetical protein